MNNALQVKQRGAHGITLTNKVYLWAEGSTMAHIARRKDLIRDKARCVGDFFDFVGLDFDNFQPDQLNRIKPEHVKGWQFKLESEGMSGGKGPLSVRSVYGAMSKVSSFYKWAMSEDSELAPIVELNPVAGQLPKLGRPYQSDKITFLSVEQCENLKAVIEEKTQNEIPWKRLQAFRDLAIFTHLLLTGRRRAEVIGLAWGAFDFKSKPIKCLYHVKGGKIENRKIESAEVEETMRQYLKEAGRLDSMAPETRIWVSHRDSPVSIAGSPLTASAFAKVLKTHGRKAGIPDIRVHTLRKTYAVHGLELTGSVKVMQEALGHSSDKTTMQFYSGPLNVYRDKVGPLLADYLGFNGSARDLELQPDKSEMPYNGNQPA